jgi:outer membrane beta-barrel protein
MPRRLALCLGLILAAAPALAVAEPATLTRVELGPSVGLSLDRALRQAILIGARLEVHLTDHLTVGLDAGYGVGLDTGFSDELASRLGPADWTDRSRRFSTIRLAGDLRASLTLLSGKLGIFSRVFVAYDLHLFAGLGLALLANDHEGNDAEDAVSEGLRLGPALGLGLRVRITRHLALGAEVKDLVFFDNESGGDLTRGTTDAERAAGKVLIDADDQSFSSHWFVGLRLSLCL